MKKFFTLIAAIIVAVFGFNVNAGSVYSLVGAFNSWSNSDKSTEFTDKGNGVYELTGVTITAGGFKIIADHSWSEQYGSDGSAVELGKDFTMKSNASGEPQNVVFSNFVSTFKDCTVIFKLADGKATLNITGTAAGSAINSWCLCGAFNSWDITNAPKFTDKGNGVYELKVDGFSGEFGIYADNSWNIGLKSNSSNDAIELGKEYEVGQGSNLKLADATKVYNGCTFTLKVGDKITLLVTSESQEAKEAVYSLVGSFNGWKYEDNLFTKKSDGVYEIHVAEFKDDFKIVKDMSWSTAYCSNGSDIELNTPYALAAPGNSGDNINIKNGDTVKDCTFTLTVAADGSASLVMSGTSGVSDLAADGVKIVAGNGEINVEGADAVAVYTTGGALVSTKATTSVAAGMYIVKAGNKVAKVVVK